MELCPHQTEISENRAISHPHTGDLQGRAGPPFLTKLDVLMNEAVSYPQIGLPKGEAAPPPSAWAC